MDLRYPIGQFHVDCEITSEQREKWIKDLEEAPVLFQAAVDGLNIEQLDTPYRPGGWTVRQVVHHLADSNINSYVRFKLAVTEDKPTVKTYDQEKWADLDDSREAPVEVSLKILESLHVRWVQFLKSLSDEEFKRTFIHPDSGIVSLETNLGVYSWHCRHHTAHISSLRQRMRW